MKKKIFFAKKMKIIAKKMEFFYIYQKNKKNIKIFAKKMKFIANKMKL